MWWKSKKTYPQFYRQYLDQFDQKYANTDIISLDIETDSLIEKSAQIISFGSVDIVNNRVVMSSAYERFFLGQDDNSESIKIHEIFSSEHTQILEDNMPEILERIGTKIILGHYIEFDIRVINHTLKRMGAGPLKNDSKDTLQMALAHDGVRDLSRVKREDYTLYALCHRFGIEVRDSHQALTDAYLAALLYLHL